jgi:hypothetical protein
MANTVCCDWIAVLLDVNNLQDSWVQNLYKYHIDFTLCVDSFHSVDKLITGHIISVAESKSAIEHKFLPVKKKNLDIMNNVKTTQNVPSGRKRERENKEHNISVSTLSTVTLNEDYSKSL